MKSVSVISRALTSAPPQNAINPSANTRTRIRPRHLNQRSHVVGSIEVELCSHLERLVNRARLRMTRIQNVEVCVYRPNEIEANREIDSFAIRHQRSGAQCYSVQQCFARSQCSLGNFRNWSQLFSNYGTLRLSRPVSLRLETIPFNEQQETVRTRRWHMPSSLVFSHSVFTGWKPGKLWKGFRWGQQEKSQARLLFSFG